MPKAKKVDLLDIMFFHAQTTPGVWTTSADGIDPDRDIGCVIYSKYGKAQYIVADSGDWGGLIVGADALFIVKAHEMMPAMTKELNFLRTQVARLKKQVLPSRRSAIVHLMPTRGSGTSCGQDKGTRHPDIERVTCRKCIAVHNKAI